MKKTNIPTHDPQTGELNPYYEELTGEKNPLEIKSPLTGFDNFLIEVAKMNDIGIHTKMTLIRKYIESLEKIS